MSKVHIIVSGHNTGDKVNVEIGFLPNEERLTIRQSAHLLASGLSLLIKSVDSKEISDFELMKEIIEHLNGEFISHESFSDKMKNESAFKKEDK
jgi:hypothetical protein